MRSLATLPLALLVACSPTTVPAPVVDVPPTAAPPAPPTASAAPTAAPSASPEVPGVWRAEIPKPPAARCGGAVSPPPAVKIDAPTWKPAAAAPAGATAKACAALEKGRKTKIKAITKEPSGMDAADLAKWRDGMFRCTGAGQGAWAIDVAANPTAGWTLVYFGADGRATATRSVPLDDYAEVAVQGVYDFDGDGVPEAVVAVSQYSGAMEGDIIPAYEIHRLRAGKVERYPGTEKLSLHDLRDLDGDGRPDLLVPSRYSFSLHHGEMGDAGGFHEVLHARPDGTFAADDAVAREAARLFCDRVVPTTNLISGEQEDGPHLDGWALGTWLSCSRLWGVPASALEAQIRRRFPAKAQGAGEPVLDEVCAAARVAPPFTLALPCAP